MLGIKLPGWLAPVGLVAVLISVLYAGVGTPPEGDEDEPREKLAGDPEA